VHYDQQLESLSDSIAMNSARPDFSILVYPVISMQSELTHGGSKQALLGDNPDPELVEFFSNEKRVSMETPPAILIHASDDQAVPVQNSLAYYEALIKKGVSAELHVYPYGGHGFSLATQDIHLRTWMERVMEWMDQVVKHSED
jgi:dipeptidyl aminopeptidase/acylaminoacyl peptidase